MAGNVDVMQQLLDAGVDVDGRDDNGRTALMHACSHARAKEVEWLLAHDAFEYAKDAKGNTCLYYAMRSGSQKILDVLQLARPWLGK